MKGRHRRRQPRLSDFALGSIVIVVILLASALGFKKGLPFRHHYTVNAVFETASNLRANSKVRIAGVDVGKVTKVEELTPGRSVTLVEMRIQEKGLPLHKDATAKIRPRIFLEGNFFVDLHPGSPSARNLEDGDTIPITRTASPVQFDQVLTTLQTDTRQDLRSLLIEIGKAFNDGGAQAYNNSIPYWTPAYKNTAIVSDALLGTTRHDLSGYVRGQGAVSQALASDEVALKSLLTDLNTTARAFAVARDDLASAVEELPRTLGAGRPALAALDESFPPLRRMTADMRPAVRSTGPAIDALMPLVRQLRGGVSQAELRGLTADLRPAVSSLARLMRYTVPLLGQVRLASSCQNEVVLPWTEDKIVDPDFPATRKVGHEATKFLPGIAGESRSGDANGQWFRILGNLGPNAYPLAPGMFFLSDTPLRGVNPPKPYKRSSLRPDVPCETQQAPDLRTVAGPAPAGQTARIPASKMGEYRKMRNRAVRWVRRMVRLQGLDDKLKVSSKPITREALDRLLRSAKR
jgi:phospholipid/cholesterol/gamma-HCH transport system substrate-binding protein